MCYWPGGGKKEQFLPSFGKRSRIRGSAANTQQESNKPLPTINAASISEENDQVFTCITMGNSKFKVHTIPYLQPNHRSDDYISLSFSISNQQIYNAKKVVNSHRHVSGEISLVCCTNPINKSDIPILLNFGANNYCFADISLFMSYTLFDQLLPRLTAEKRLMFNIAGEGSVKL